MPLGKGTYGTQKGRPPVQKPKARKPKPPTPPLPSKRKRSKK